MVCVKGSPLNEWQRGHCDSNLNARELRTRQTHASLPAFSAGMRCGVELAMCWNVQVLPTPKFYVNFTDINLQDITTIFPKFR